MRSRNTILAMFLLAMILGGIVAGVALREDASSTAGSSSGLQCGHWCVFRCAQLLGIPVNMKDIVSQLPRAPRGHSMLQVASTLHRIGLVTDGRRGSWKTLLKTPFPCIAHLKNPEHYIVICSVEPDSEYLHVFDGGGRRIRQSRKVFEKQWSGVLLAVTRPKDAASFQEQPREHAIAAPQAQFDTLLVDLGDVPAVGKPVEFVFPVRNGGTTELVVKNVLTSCDCLRCEKPEEPIRPGEESAVRLLYNVESKKGPFRHSALVETNDPEAPHIILTATGFSGAEVRVHPSKLHLGDLVIQRECSARCFVKYTGSWKELEVQIDDVSLDGAVLVSHSCTTSEEKGSPVLALGCRRRVNARQRTKVLEFVFRAARNGPSRVRGSIVVRTNIEGYELLTIPVKGRIRCPIQAYPSMLVFSDVDPQASLRQAVTLVSRVAEPFEITSVEGAPASIQCEYPHMAVSDRADIVFRASGRALLEAAGSDVLVRLRLCRSGEEVTVPLAVHAWPGHLRRK
jgi:hypothetical protein